MEIQKYKYYLTHTFTITYIKIPKILTKIKKAFKF